MDQNRPSETANIGQEKPGWLVRWGFMPAVVVFFLSLGGTFMAWQYAAQLLQQDYWQQLVIHTNSIAREIENRNNQHLGILRGTAGFFAGSERVEPHEWQQFVDALELDSLPSTPSALAFAAIVAESDRERFLQEAPDSTPSGLTIRPAGIRTEYFLPLHIEPPSMENQPVLGYDLGTNDQLLFILTQVRDSGKLAVTGKIPSITTGEPAFLFAAPVFKGQPDDPQERRSSTLGFVFTLFEARGFFEGLPQPGGERPIQFLVYTHAETELVETLLYASHPEINDVNRIPEEYLRHQSVLQVADQEWKVVFFQPPPSRPRELADYVPGLILMAGTAFSTMLFVLFGALSTTGMGAVEQARKAARRLQTSEAQYANIIRATQDLIFHTDQTGKILLVSPSVERLLHIPPGSFINRSAQELFSDPAEFAGLLAALQRGETIWGRKISLALPSGKPLALSASAYLLGKTAGNLSEIEWILRDDLSQNS